MLMKGRLYRRWVAPPIFCAGLMLGGTLLPAIDPPPAADPAEDPNPLAGLIQAAPEGSASGITFLTEKTRLWLDRNQVLCFYSRQPVEDNHYFSFTADENFVHVLMPPTILPGANIGYIRLRPVQEGRTEIRLEGASIDIEIVKDTAASTLEETRPEIVSPAQKAVVWGKFLVGVERLNLSSNRQPVAPWLRMPDGDEIEGREVPDQKPGPHLRYTFEIDANSLEPGGNELVSFARDDSGHETDSDPLEVEVIHPDEDSILQGKCVDEIDTPVPEPRNRPPPKAIAPPVPYPDTTRAFAYIIRNTGEAPPWCMPVTVPAKGRYQMMVEARGDIGGNALPTVALLVDDAQNPVTSSRLATTEWHRVPVGVPFELEAGQHVLSVHFRNPFGQGPADSRVLYLARYELVRLDDPTPPPGPGGSMMQEAVSTQAMHPLAAFKPTIIPSGFFQVAFKDALDGETIAGPVQVNAACWWPDQGHAPAPTVDLLLNGKVEATSTLPQPQFQIPIFAFQAGENKIQLQGSLPSGQHSHSPVESVFLPAWAASGTSPPRATISYPAPGAKVGMADAVVANVFGPAGGVHADLLIDGQAQHFNFAPKDGLGPVLFPLLTRGLLPGEHHLRVVVQDGAGHSGQSNEVKIVVADKGGAANTNYARALLLLNRFGYGPETRELAAILTMGAHGWLSARLNEDIGSPLEENESAQVESAYPDPNAAAPRALQYLISDANPVRARFLMWTENHFSTWINKVGPAEKAREHNRFLELGVAPFPDLLLASATSPAMLIYLDQRNSFAKRLNENYAREIMELHTLGVKGGYSQADVTTLADLLTGWTLADEAPADGGGMVERTFRYDPALNSGTPCSLLGMEFPGVPLERRFDRVVAALNMLSAHPSCAHFISRKLVEHYVADPAPPALVDDLARTYLETGGDLRVMLLVLSEQPAFWTPPVKIASPIDFGVRLARMAGLTNPGPVAELASKSGMGMFDRATPDGYPDTDGYYASSNALLQRWHFAQNIQNNFLADGLIPDAWKPADNAWDPDTTQRLVDLAAVRITGNVLSPNSNEAALKLIAESPENTASRLHLLATFLCQVPETSLR
jgi:uncharacterized protein (DUF1800 family)